MRIFLLSNNNVVFTNDDFLATSFAIYTVTTSYPYMGTCLSSYYVSGSQCIKNLSYIPPTPPVPLIPPAPAPTPSISNANQTPSAEIQNSTN